MLTATDVPSHDLGKASYQKSTNVTRGSSRSSRSSFGSKTMADGVRWALVSWLARSHPFIWLCFASACPLPPDLTELIMPVGSDAAAHMSEEIEDASVVVPRAMVTSFFANGFMGLVVLMSFLFCIPNVEDALNDPTGYSFLFVLRSSMSNGAINGITMIVLLLMLASNVNFFASTSRQAFALACDNGLPCMLITLHDSCLFPCRARGSLN